MAIIVAIDGPSGSGKSSVAKILGNKLNLAYLDTGAMYRVVTYYMLENKIDVNNANEVINNLGNIKIDFDDGYYSLNNVQLIDEIRSPQINQNVSAVAKIKEVRQYCVELQREIAKKTNTILDGRDIGTVVFPNASLKFYLDASAETRAKRRYEENLGTTNEQQYEDVLQDIINRDEIDKNREESPLVQADDAIYIDTSEMSLEEVVSILKQKIEDII